VAAGLAPGGVFASFGGPFRLANPDLSAAVATARAPWLADDEVPSPDGTPPTDQLQWPGTELTTAAEFVDVRQETLPRRLVMDADDFVGHLSTVSAYLQLREGDRARALRAVVAVLPAQVEVDADLTVHLARRDRDPEP
jgi:hypothetical protein